MTQDVSAPAPRYRLPKLSQDDRKVVIALGKAKVTDSPEAQFRLGWLIALRRGRVRDPSDAELIDQACRTQELR